MIHMILKFFINICKQDPKRYPRFLVPNEPEKQTNQHCWTRETEEKNHSVYLLCLKENTTRGVILACPNCQCSDPGDLQLGRLCRAPPSSTTSRTKVGPLAHSRRWSWAVAVKWGSQKWRIDFWHLKKATSTESTGYFGTWFKLSSITIYKSSIIICKMDHSPHLC